MSSNMSNESPQKTSESPTRRGTTSDKEKKSSADDEPSSGNAVIKQESNMSSNKKDNGKNSTEHNEKSGDVKTGSQGSAQEKQRKTTAIWCDSSDATKGNQVSAGGTQISDCTQTNTYHSLDPRTGYLQFPPPGIYPTAASSHYFPPAMNFQSQPCQQSNRSNERFFQEEHHGRNMGVQNGGNSNWRDAYLHSQAYPNAPQQFQMVPRSGNARSKNNCNNKVQANYVQPRMVYSDAIDKPLPNYPPHMPMPSQPPGVYSHNYFQDPGYNVRSPRKGDRPVMQNYGKKEMDRQRGFKTPAQYYPDPREAMNYKRPLPTAEDYRFNYPDGRDPRFAGNRQITGSPKYLNDARFMDSSRREFIRYPSPPERLLESEIGYPPMPYPRADQNAVSSIRYPQSAGYPPPAEYKPCTYMNQGRIEPWPVGLGSRGSNSQNLNVTSPVMDIPRNIPGEYVGEGRARHDQMYYDPSYQVTRVRSNEKVDFPYSDGQKRPMPPYIQPPMMSSMMPPMKPQMVPPMYQNPPNYYQAMPPQQMLQQDGPDCYGVLLDEIDSAQPASHLRRCGEFPEIMSKTLPEGCDKKNTNN